jgi:hypothetical protein
MWFVIVLLVCSFIGYSVYLGLIGVEEFEFRLEVKRFSSPYFMFGVFFVEHTLEDPEYIEQELTIALFLVTFVFIFYKEKNDA